MWARTPNPPPLSCVVRSFQLKGAPFHIWGRRLSLHPHDKPTTASNNPCRASPRRSAVWGFTPRSTLVKALNRLQAFRGRKASCSGVRHSFKTSGISGAPEGPAPVGRGRRLPARSPVARLLCYSHGETASDGAGSAADGGGGPILPAGPPKANAIHRFHEPETNQVGRRNTPPDHKGRACSDPTGIRQAFRSIRCVSKKRIRVAFPQMVSCLDV